MISTLLRQSRSPRWIRAGRLAACGVLGMLAACAQPREGESALNQQCVDECRHHLDQPSRCPETDSRRQFCNKQVSDQFDQCVAQCVTTKGAKSSSSARAFESSAVVLAHR